jgi:hypothetical protein
MVSILDARLDEWISSLPALYVCLFLKLQSRGLANVSFDCCSLRWDPDRREADVWYRQSADLILKFNMVYAQSFLSSGNARSPILTVSVGCAAHSKTYIHRPFLPSPRNPIPISTNSFVVCIDAASQCAEVIDCYSRKRREAIPHLFESAYTCAVRLFPAAFLSRYELELDPDLAILSFNSSSSSLQHGPRRHQDRTLERRCPRSRSAAGRFFGIGRAR